MTLAADVAVIGAGPAGCVLAIRLVQLGWRVLLVERSASPRPQSGQSLTPGVRLQLAQLGLSHVLTLCGARPAPLSRVRWQGLEAEDRVMAQDPPLLVDRGRFDAMLRGAAVGAGVRLLCPARLIHRDQDADGWTLTLDDGAERRRARVSVLVDATGRAGLLARDRSADGPATLALFADWRGTDTPVHPCVDHGPDHWVWGLPRGDGLFSTLLFVDADAVPKRAELCAFLRDRLAASTLLGDFRQATTTGPVRGVDSTAYRANRPIGPGWIAVGDAAMALDPLSSSGVQKAIRTALSAAIVLNTRLRRPDQAALAERFYTEDLRDGADQHRRWTEGFFASAAHRFSATPAQGNFWLRRAVGTLVDSADTPPTMPDPDQPLTLAPAAQWRATACLVDNFVEERMALHHPALARPIAWLAGVELAPLMLSFPPVTSLRALIESWSTRIGPSRATTVATWLTRCGVLETAP